MFEEMQELIVAMTIKIDNMQQSKAQDFIENSNGQSRYYGGWTGSNWGIHDGSDSFYAPKLVRLDFRAIVEMKIRHGGFLEQSNFLDFIERQKRIRFLWPLSILKEMLNCGSKWKMKMCKSWYGMILNKVFITGMTLLNFKTFLVI